jgi:3-oxoacyl-[acyl-carrier-protein] synthase II
MGVSGFYNMRALSKSRDPLRASIPFDLDRDGFVIGEGAGVLVLEAYEHALARGAVILGEIVGYGATCDAFHMTAPDPEAVQAARCMEAAMADAGIGADRIGYINAHGTSTPLNDAGESLAIRRVFGDRARSVKISSTKSMTGHLLGAAGAVEAIASALALRDQWVPPTAGLLKPDPACDLDYQPCQGQPLEFEYALSNSFGFGGHNACLVLKRYVSE